MKYDTEELDTLVKEWIDFQIKMRNAKTHDEEDAIKIYDMELMDYIIQKLPKLGLSIILNILKQVKSDELYPVLAAGELEDLLSIHGETILNDIEKIAKSNPKFKKLLGGIWQGDMTDDIYQKIIEIIGGTKNKW